MRYRSTLWIGVLILLAGCVERREVASVPPYQAPSPVPSPARMLQFTATAYTVQGKTASGARTREGVCAADPAVLPIGSRIRVQGAGRRSGEYVVKDTGREIDAHELDLYIADDREAKRFGRRRVTVQVLRYGAEGAGGRP